MSAESLRMVVHLTVDESLYCSTFPSFINMFPWNDIGQVCSYIYNKTGILCSDQRLFFRGRELTSYRKKRKATAPSLSSYGITNGCTIYLQCSFACLSRPIVCYGQSNLSNSSLLMINESISGLNAGYRAILSTDGEGGTYFLMNGLNERISCFKPCDEEAGAINNPRGRIYVSSAFHCGIKPREGHLREIAAYLFDELNGHFHDVPPTIRVEICSNNNFNNNNNNKCKIGSLQSYICGEVIENFGVKNFSIRQVHKIGILDILILNSDRNSGNILVSKIDDGKRYCLIPIDHGLSLPNYIEITTDSWVWINWIQSKQPFDSYTIDYINKINIDESIELLRKELNLDEIVFQNMRITHLVLKKGIMRGLTLNQIGSIIARPNFNTKSILEELMIQAESLSIEKCRQNKHLYNRIRFKRKNKDILDKFIEKGKSIKIPQILSNKNEFQLLNRAPTHSNSITMSSLTPEPFINDNNNNKNVNNDENNEIIKPFYSITPQRLNTNNNNNIIPCLSLEIDEKEEVNIHSPIQIEFIEKTSSIHDRDEIINNNNNKKGLQNMIIYNQISEDNAKPFSALNIENLIKQSKESQSQFVYENDDSMLPLSRSTSCIDTKSSTLSLNNSFDLKSASLINHKSMIDKRREVLSNGYCIKEEEDDINNDSPSTTSHKSQDDMIPMNPNNCIHPIMERMSNNRYFMYYLDQLLGIQCERISKRSRKCDTSDNIYDIDTVSGAFIWKNELRKHWIRSRLERKKLLAPKPPTNPFKNKNNNNNNFNDDEFDKIENKTLYHEYQDDDEEDDGHEWFGADTTIDYDQDDYDDD